MMEITSMKDLKIPNLNLPENWFLSIQVSWPASSLMPGMAFQFDPLVQQP